jgi:transcriptional regulator NrdR family protein
MICPKCNNDTEVINTKNEDQQVIRYRQCISCKYRFKTLETQPDGWDYKAIVSNIKNIVENVG